LDVKIYKITIKATVEERILDLQERKRQLANATIEGKTAAAKLTMRDMMALFGREAELRFDPDHDQNLDLSQRTRLLGPADEEDDVHSPLDSNSQLASRSNNGGEEFSSWILPSSQSSNHSQAERKKTQPSRVEHSVYGRRWWLKQIKEADFGHQYWRKKMNSWCKETDGSLDERDGDTV
jgi:SNF2 family DNA or RNA helicase